jgi:uncharacterized protein YcaQ
LWPGRRWTGKAGAAQALREVEAVQIDPVSIVAQSHDIVLWGRVIDYRPEHLNSLLYEERKFFDYGGGLMIYPMDELPYWRVVMERRKLEKRWAEFAEANPALLDRVKQELRERGPLRNRDLDGRQMDHYRASKDTGVALYFLWLTGELMTHSRQGKERVYDFLDNVAPESVRQPAADEEAENFFARKAIAHRGLVDARTFRNMWKGLIERPVDAKEAQSKLAELVESRQAATVRIEGHKEPHYILASDASILKELQSGKTPRAWQPLETTTGEEVIFLSPLETISARGRAGLLFDFDYIWEIYKPAAERKWGPYTMPILYDDRLVARLDAKLDRQSQELLINGFWLERWFKPDDAFAAAFVHGLLRFARFLNAERLNVAALRPKSLRQHVDRIVSVSRH